ncbi:MAG TPA: YceD family protein [Acidimicrobiia bacterium]|jgi:uncharacterized protein|nr:YceD family protein [Acidimicrobiia bacterium]
MSANPFLVHARDLLANPGKVREHTVDASVDWGIELARVSEDHELHADLDLVSTSGGVLVRGAVDVVAATTCARCLAESESEMRIEVAQMVEHGADDDDEYHTTGDDLDLEPILRDEVLLAMPLRPQCEPACEGLVQGSETDLNTPAPGSARRTDSPFAALQDLFGPGD